jgi:hypothetical protein
VLGGWDAEVRALLGPLVFGVDADTMESVVLDLLRSRGLSLGLAESLTGGLVSARLVGVPGASDVLRGSIVSYATDVKHDLLDVPPGPVVSEEAALAMAVGAFGSGLALRRLDGTLVTLSGLATSIGGLLLLSTVRIDTEFVVPLAAVSLFGLGFGLTVTPRTTAAVEVAGRAAFGMASGVVTVARMAGMGLGMAILTAFATTRIDSVSMAIEDQAFRDSILPPELVGAPLGDPLVLDALEHWASGQAAEVLGQLFVVAAVVLLVTAIPAWWMRRPGRRSDALATDDHGQPVPGAAVPGGALPGAGLQGTADGGTSTALEAGEDAGDRVSTSF